MKKTKNNSQLTLGTDPEVFLWSTKDNIFYPSFGIINGDKEIPFQIPELPTGFTTQVDNVMCEFNIPASSNEEEFSNNIQKVLDHLKKTLPESLVVKIQPSAEFTDEMLKSDHAHLVGCSEDFSAYTGSNVSVKNLSESNYRYAGGHVHVGYPDHNYLSSLELIKWMDIFLGLPSVILDTDEKRKAVYGTPGRWRDKSFGLEYRVLSNWWIEEDEYRRFIFRQTEKAYYAFKENVIIGEEFEAQVQDCIKNNNAEQARILMAHFNVTDDSFNEIFNLKLKQYADSTESN